MKDLVPVILDNECDPRNPYVIHLHCVSVFVHWKRIESGKWENDKWIAGKYDYTIKVG